MFDHVEFINKSKHNIVIEPRGFFFNTYKQNTINISRFFRLNLHNQLILVMIFLLAIWTLVHFAPHL